VRERYLQTQVLEDLTRKMVFVGGPRQVGKTTFARSLTPKHTYLNWDVDGQRTKILDKELGEAPLLILDELHKFHRWRNYLKGLYDAQGLDPSSRRKILVTGSARLDYYRHGGDSLQGRYHYLRLMPFSYREIAGDTPSAGVLEDLFTFGGFPEPLFGRSEREAKRWSREYRARLVRDDLRDLERVHDAALFEILVGRIPECVGSPLSLNGLREDLQIAHATAAKWVDMLERLYFLFRLPPIGPKTVRAVKKEQKAYCYDWTNVKEPGARFENLVAAHLLKWVYWRQDAFGDDLSLGYFRDRDGHEVDFVISDGGHPTHLIECKFSSEALSSSLLNLHRRYPKAEAWQIHYAGSKDYVTAEGVRVSPAGKLLGGLI
jgi:hypothetical protein